MICTQIVPCTGFNRFRWISVFALLLFFGLYHLQPFAAYPGSEKEETLSIRTDQPVYGGNYRRGLDHDPATLDPAKLSDIYGAVVIQQIVEGLVQYSDNLMVIPCLAQSWKSSRDNLRWVFHLKKGVQFHNGREVTAEDFVYTYTRILRPETESGAASLLAKIEGAEEFIEGKTDGIRGLQAPDRYTLEIRLSEPFPPFIAMLAMVNFGVVPREEVEREGQDFGLYPVGTGPFRFDHWYRNEEVVLISNDNYHEDRPYLDRIVFKIFPGGSTDQMFDEFEKGNLEDSLIAAEMRERILTENKYPILRRPSLAVRFLVMNNTVEPFTSEKVRKAFNYAIDKETISAEVGKGRLIPATGLIPKGMAGYQPDDTNYPYSPEKAAQLLKEAGYPDGKGLPVIQFWSSVKSRALLAEDQAIKRYLSAIGVRIEFNYLTDWPAFKHMLEEGKAPIFKYSWEADIPDPDNILSSLFHSESPTNRAFYRNPDIDALIEKAQNESDYQERIALYSAIQDRIMEDAPVILLNYLAYERAFQSYVRGFEGKVLGDHYFSLKRVWLDRSSM